MLLLSAISTLWHIGKFTHYFLTHKHRIILFSVVFITNIWLSNCSSCCCTIVNSLFDGNCKWWHCHTKIHGGIIFFCCLFNFFISQNTVQTPFVSSHFHFFVRKALEMYLDGFSTTCDGCVLLLLLLNVFRIRHTLLRITIASSKKGSDAWQKLFVLRNTK